MWAWTHMCPGPYGFGPISAWPRKGLGPYERRSMWVWAHIVLGSYMRLGPHGLETMWVQANVGPGLHGPFCPSSIRPWAHVRWVTIFSQTVSKTCLGVLLRPRGGEHIETMLGPR